MSLAEFLRILYQWQWLPFLGTFSGFYLAYYFLHVVQKPKIFGKDGPFRRFLQNECAVLSDYYWPTIWCFGAHAQTVVRALLRSRPPVPFRRETLDTPDGGIMCLDWFDHENSHYTNPLRRPTVLVLPGLTGGSETSYCRHLVLQGEKLGYRTIIANHRGFGASQLKTPRTFCAANTEDLKFVIDYIHGIYPGCPVLAVGISMGGMILMNYLNEMKDADCGLIAGLVVSIPWDCAESTVSLEQPLNFLLFNRRLTGNLVRMVKSNLNVFQGRHNLYDINHVLNAKTVREFDERFTSPTFGYSNYEEYYNAASLHTKPLHTITVPVLCLTAADDPFSPLHAIPLKTIGNNPLFTLVLTAYGGHIGFIEGVMIHEQNYMDRVFAQFAKGVFDMEDTGEWQKLVSETRELARESGDATASE
ncbi:phospholipase ABHD3 isoform X2 [Nematostella vectensis]|uniref:phospholipase ABHD3 isoform X2 n=1 Tax=Nematostella vectensis TaxID=45351 RepID=UPI00207741A5|nr:phospholipase ABHD3 isoform X2 [Nematostella vectensis]